MSLLIKDMGYTPPRKPDKVYLVYHFDDDIGSFSHSICVTDKLIELPPHGRLIDADAFLAKTKEDPLFPLVERYGMSSVIEAQPTIIPAEEVPGHE